MSASTKIAINGASGRMGQSLIGLLRGDRQFELGGAVIDAASELVGRPVYMPNIPGATVYSANWDNIAALDVVVDFSVPEGLAAALDYCLENKVALVTGTTGLDNVLNQRLLDASQHIPVLRAANFSLGVAVLKQLIHNSAKALPEWDLEILEAHHSRKQDAPSGTALALGEEAAKARHINLQEQGVFERHGHTGERHEGSIGFSVIRGGDLVGEHTALLLGEGERIELTHRATDRRIFARGALTAAKWLSTREPGKYAIAEVLFGSNS